MTAKLHLPEDTISRFLAGESVPAIAKSLGVSMTPILGALAEAGIPTRGNRLDLDDAVVDRYLAGESELSIATSLGVSRPAIRRKLVAEGVSIRDRSAAGRARASRMSPAERAAQASAAHDAVRGKPLPLSSKLARAATIERQAVAGIKRRSAGEIRLGEWLTDAGLHFIPEKAVGVYNLDFGIHPVAVELFGGAWHGYGYHAGAHGKRTKHILGEGWSIIFVWSTKDIPLNRRGGEKIVSLVKKLRRNPPSPGEYWVIRGDGEVVAQGRADGNDIPVILPTYANPQGGPVD